MLPPRRIRGKCLNKVNLWRHAGCCVISSRGSRLNVTPLYECPIDQGDAAHFSLGRDRTDGVKQGGEYEQPNKCQTEGVLIVYKCVCVCEAK